MANLQKIKVLAREKKITLAQLASDIGITQQALLKIIRENSTKIETLERISNILKVSPAIFFEDDITKNVFQVAGGDAMYQSAKTTMSPEEFSLVIKEKDERIKDLKDQINDLRNYIEYIKTTTQKIYTPSVTV